MDYEFASPPPWDHQRAGFLQSRDAEMYAILWEQRTGKSRVIIDTAAYAYERGRIDGVLLLAPNGVHRNWVTEGFGQFLPERIPALAVTWASGKMESKKAAAALAGLVTHDGLSILSMNYDAISTAAAKKYLGSYLKKRKLLIVADESDDLSHPNAVRTKTALRAAKYGVMRRILTGTPAAENPFSLYAQTNFLQFGLLGYTSYLSFKHAYAEWEDGYNHNTSTQFETIKRNDDGSARYKNLDDLQRRLAPFSSRITRANCGGQLPAYASRPFALSAEQQAAYDQLRSEFVAEFATGTLTTSMVLVRYTRLQQITSGFVPLDRSPDTCPRCAGMDDDCPTCAGIGIILSEQHVHRFGTNPRLDALERELRGTDGATVIWTRFIHDADAVMARLTEMGRRPGRYDGQVDEKTREATKLAFQAGALTDMVASPQAGGRGLDFSRARTAIFYSHHWSLRLRLQAQDRVETLKRADPVVIVDLVAQDTIDDMIVGCHRNKRAVQDHITGDFK